MQDNALPHPEKLIIVLLAKIDFKETQLMRQSSASPIEGLWYIIRCIWELRIISKQRSYLRKFFKKTVERNVKVEKVERLTKSMKENLMKVIECQAADNNM